MKKIIQFFDKLPWLIKIILCLPAFDVIWGAYRIIKGIYSKNKLIIVAGILWIVPGFAICWIIDMLNVVISKKLTILA